MHDKQEITWEAPEFEYMHKGPNWYWLTILVMFVLVAIALWQGNFLFAVFVLIAGVLIMIWGSHYPRHMEFKVDDEGLEIVGQKTYPYRDLKAFAVKPGHVDSEWSEILITKRSHFSPHVKIFIPDEQLKEVEDFLAQHIEQIEYEDSLVDHIGKLLRF